MKLVSALALVCLCVSAQTAKYPSAVATDADLLVAKNNLQAKLLSPVGISDTSIALTNGTGFVQNMAATLDKEIVFVCGVSGNILTIGTPTTCPSSSGRGYDGTTAAIHNLGPCSSTNLTGCVSANVIGLHHNQLAKELEAVQNTLGANLQNVPLILPLAYKNAPTFAFAAQQPGGSLIIGNTSTTMTPVPLGVNGTDTGHYLYVSSGVGTAEACLITGGTGTSGQTTGQIILNCAHTHSGAFTVQSANGGIQEAVVAAGVNGSVGVPCGNYNIYGQVSIPYQDMKVLGQGNCSVLYPQFDGMKVFAADTVAGFLNLDLGGFQILPPGGIALINTIRAVSIVNSSFATIHDLVCADIYYCVYLDRVNSPIAERVYLVDNSTIWAGSTVGGGFGFTSNATFSKLKQYPTGGYAMSTGDYYLTLSRCITCTVRDFKMVSVAGSNGILLQDDVEGATLDDVTIAVPINGIVLKKGTVSGVPLGPSFTEMSKLNIDRWTGTAVSIDDLCYFNTVSQSNFTGSLNVGQTAAIHFLANPTGGVVGGLVTGNVFQNIWSGTSVWIDASNSYIGVTDNYFDGYNGQVGVVISAGAGDYNTISGNTFSFFRSNTFAPMQIVASGAHTNISGNSGVLDVYNRSAFANLGAAPPAGTHVYCTDCTTASPCAGSGSGHMATSNGANWTCN